MGQQHATQIKQATEKISEHAETYRKHAENVKNVADGVSEEAGNLMEHAENVRKGASTLGEHADKIAKSSEQIRHHGKGLQKGFEHLSKAVKEGDLHGATGAASDLIDSTKKIRKTFREDESMQQQNATSSTWDMFENDTRTFQQTGMTTSGLVHHQLINLKFK